MHEEAARGLGGPEKQRQLPGPDPRGRIQPEFVERLEQVGKWLEINGESIYGAGKSEITFNNTCPQLFPKFTRKDNNLYMHFFDKYPSFPVIAWWLGDGKINYMEFLKDGTDIAFEEFGDGHMKFQPPVIYPDPYNTVIKVVLN